jgi:hypothetical protein
VTTPKTDEKTAIFILPIASSALLNTVKRHKKITDGDIIHKRGAAVKEASFENNISNISKLYAKNIKEHGEHKITAAKVALFILEQKFKLSFRS